MDDIELDQMLNKMTVYSSIGFLDLLLLVFIVLKLINAIDWSWWVVLSPLWGQYALVALIVIVVLIVRFIFDKRKRD